jgi:DNA polymerase-3 subunit beta
MQIKVSREKLSKALSLLAGVVEKHTTIPILSHLKIVADATCLTLAATDLEIALEDRIEAEVLAEGAIAIPAVKFERYVGLLESEEVSLKVDDRNFLLVQGGKAKSRMAGEGIGSFPEMPEFRAEGGWALSGETLAAIVKRVRRCVIAGNNNHNHKEPGGIRLIFNGESVTATTTDSRRVAMTEVECTGAPGKLLIPLRAADQAARVFADQESVSISGDGNNISISSGERRMICRKLAAQFPDIERVMPKQPKRSARVNGATWAIAIRRAQLESDVLSGSRSSHEVACTFNCDAIRVVAGNRDGGSAEEDVSAVLTEGNAVTFRFNSEYLLDALGGIDGEAEVWFYDDPRKPVLIQAPQQKHLICGLWS